MTYDARSVCPPVRSFVRAGGAEAPAGGWPGDIVMESGVEEPRRLGAQCECDVAMGGAPATSAAVA